MGTIAAAAVRRVYEELEHDDSDDLEIKRWRWYQRYHQAVTENPIGALWAGVPHPVDFFSETPPAQDPSVDESLRPESEAARRHYYLLVKCGVWLANLPVRVSTIATLVVMYVRRTEGYGNKVVTWLSFYRNFSMAVAGVLFHLIRSPHWTIESTFSVTPPRRGVRPLIGWFLYGFTIFAPLLIATSLLLLVWGLNAIIGLALSSPEVRWPLILLILGAAFFGLDHWAFATVSDKTKKNSSLGNKRSWYGKLLLKSISNNLDITTGLIHPFEVQRTIFNLFVKDAPAFVIKGPAPDAVKALFVCAALEETDQIILKESMPIVAALTAAVAIPAVLRPQIVSRESVATTTATKTENFKVIDGASVRSNPLPAFFDWCKRIGDPDLTQRLERPDGKTPSLHVVYNVPTGYDGSVQHVGGIECPDIVLSAKTALQLAKRRDTRQEVRQTNNLSRLEWHRRLVGSTKKSAFVILADEIAPRQQIDLGSDLSPDHDKLRRTVADGCRATLETLYRDDIHAAGIDGKAIPCVMLISRVAERRAEAIGKCAGLPAVCDHCTSVLDYRPARSPNAVQEGLLKTYGQRSEPTPAELVNLFPQLAKAEPKVVFLGSGGVFRGAFHIGVLAAMYRTELFPDLVIGASVGTLMGGALCRMTAGDRANAPRVLSDLTSLFVHVDQKLSLTFTLKNAMKQLGIRARKVMLSPSELARRVRQGSKADAGYAATGAPPALTDALSSLFVIPHVDTVSITSQFVAGHFSTAIDNFLGEVRKETLASFDIRNSLMGVSLLQGQVKRLLAFTESGAELAKVQPYQGATPSGREVAFFGTTSFLNASTPMLLGRDFLTTAPSWSATQQGLCSSAFPAVFAARMEADLMPGAGRTDRFFADGGMFDNLPFFPAIEVLSAVQRGLAFSNAAEVRSRVQSRAANPNLIISAGLNATPVPDASVQWDTMFDITARATSLSYDSKTRTFTTSARKSLKILQEIGDHDLSIMDERQLGFLNGFVAATVVSITPTDADHINPTFAFCKSLGMRSERVQSSIGDGCYRSLLEFSRDPNVRKTLMKNGKAVEWVPADVRPKPAPENSCPFFHVGQAPFACPFTETHLTDVQAVFKICSSDGAHC